jgi:hypothetical protein
MAVATLALRIGSSVPAADLAGYQKPTCAFAFRSSDL